MTITWSRVFCLATVWFRDMFLPIAISSLVFTAILLVYRLIRRQAGAPSTRLNDYALPTVRNSDSETALDASPVPDQHHTQTPQLIHADEAYLDENGQSKFMFIALVWRKGHDDYFYYRHPTQDFSPRHHLRLFSHANLIPKSYYMPIPLPSMFAASVAPDDPAVFLKRPTLVNYGPETSVDAAAQDILHEAKISEILKANPHPNICTYLGYLPSAEDEGRVQGLAYERHEKNLSQAVKEQRHPIIVDEIADGIRRGLQHLHYLGLVHNDINPHNIMMAVDGRAVIVDFDSCRPIGESLEGKKRGTHGWTNNPRFSEPENDFDGLQRIQDWLRSEKLFLDMF